MQNAMWKSDEDMCEAVGSWWSEDMELHNSASMQQNVQSANEKLEEMYCTLRVLECRDGEDALEWLVVGMRAA